MKSKSSKPCVGSLLTDVNGNILYINPCAKEVLSRFFDKKNDAIKSFIKEHVKEAVREKRDVLKEVSLKPYTGRDVYLELAISYFEDPIIHESRCLVTIRDLVIEKNLYLLLEEKEGLFKSLAESTNVGILVSQENKLIFTNRAIEEISGYSRDELCKMNFWDVVHPDFKEMVREKGLRRQRGEYIPPYEFPIIRKDGDVRWILLVGSSIKVRNRPAAVVSAIDITEQKLLEDELRKREERYRSILENMEEGYFETDLKGNLIFFNRAVVRLSEADEEEKLFNLNYRKFATRDSVRKIFRAFHRVYLTKQPEIVEDFEIVTFEGRKKICEISIKLMENEKGEPVGFSGIIMDVTERKRLVREALKNFEYYQAIFENTSSGIAILNRDLLILKVNKVFEDVFRINKILVEGRRYISEFISRESRDDFFDLCKYIDLYKRSKSLELHGMNAFGQTLNLICSLSRIESEDHIIVSFVDLTPLIEIERLNLELEKQLKKSQKLEGIGLLASGIAHDFNNILQGIYANLSNLSSRNKNRDFDSKRAEENIEKFIERGSKIISELLVYARSSTEKFVPTNVNQTIEDIAILFESTLPKNVTLSISMEKELKNIHGDPTQIQQIIMNLVTNAVDAIGIKGGHIKITTRNTTGEEDLIPKGNYICLEIEDTGEGIAEEHIERIFDPFFTTKKKGKGTGLGLSIVKKIVEEHSGYIFCFSKKGKGTVFRIYFPSITTGNIHVSSEEKSIKEKKSKIPKEGINILIIEDEKMILDVSSTFLREKEFNVTEVTSGKEALKIFKERHEDFHLVILDMNIPEISGMELLDEFLKISPNKKIILSTGYSRDIVDAPKLDMDNIRFLQKPYSLDTLLDTVLEILDQ